MPGIVRGDGQARDRSARQENAAPPRPVLRNAATLVRASSAQVSARPLCHQAPDAHRINIISDAFSQFGRRIGLLVVGTGVMNVSDTVSREKERQKMTTFTIDTDNNISAFATQVEAAAAITTAYELFTTEKELAQLAGAWPAERLVAVYNSLPGAKPVKKFKTVATGASKIWKSIQGLGEAVQPVAEPVKPKAQKKAKGGAPAAQDAPSKDKASKKATPSKKAPKAKTAPARA